MSDWIVLVLILAFNAAALAYASSEPAWLVWTWKQVVRPMRWITRRVER